MSKVKRTSIVELASSKDKKKTISSSPTEEMTSIYAKRIILGLRRIMKELDTHSRHLMKHYDITVAQVVCLYEIYEKGAETLSVLSKNVHLTTSTLVGIIDRLEEKGLLKRTRNMEDRRTIFIDITEKGKEFVRTAPHLLHNRLDDKLKMLTEHDLVIIANSLDLLVSMLSCAEDVGKCDINTLENKQIY